MAAAALVAFSPGMRFWHMGQWEGRTVKLAVQLNRWPEESCGCVMWQDHVGVCQCVSQFYDVLHDLSQHEVIAMGTWEHLNQKSEEENTVFIWQWTYENQSMLIVVNYSDEEFALNRNSTGIPDHFFEDQIFPKPSDAFDGKKLRPWDVRIWLRSKD